MVESKCLQNCPGRRITLWGWEGQKEDRWVGITLENRFLPTVNAFWQICLPEEPATPGAVCPLGQRLDRFWGHLRSLLEGPAAGG